VNIKTQSADHVRWEVDQGEGSDIPKRLGGIERHNTLHDDLIGLQTQTLSETQWQIFVNLSGGQGVLDNECIVERIEESNLNQLGVFGLSDSSIGV